MLTLAAHRSRSVVPLDAREMSAARQVIDRVRVDVPACLVQASLFGSRARMEAGPRSDIDILLVFARLPEDREPHASIAERLTAAVADRTGVPVTAWSVSLLDLECGRRTPMLVDALEDAVPLWWRGRRLPLLRFTPFDALGCVDALLTRLDEGSAEVAALLADGLRQRAWARSRDDLVRLCTAGLLLRGITRPRRGAAVRAFVRLELRNDPPPPRVLDLLRWAAGSEPHVPIPPGGMAAVAEAVAGLRAGIVRGAERLALEVADPRLREVCGRNGTCSKPVYAGMPPAPSPAPAPR